MELTHKEKLWVGRLKRLVESTPERLHIQVNGDVHVCRKDGIADTGDPRRRGSSAHLYTHR